MVAMHFQLHVVNRTTNCYYSENSEGVNFNNHRYIHEKMLRLKPLILWVKTWFYRFLLILRCVIIVREPLSLRRVEMSALVSIPVMDYVINI